MRFETYEEAEQWVLGRKSILVYFEPFAKAMHMLGNPHNGLSYLHVAGTNGKGSTCRFLYDICRKQYPKVGLYTSPHLENIRDRIRINDQWIPEEVAFAKTFELLKPGGTLAMMLTNAEYRSDNEALYEKIQALYDRYYKPDIPYMHGRFRYTAAAEYGYTEVERHEFKGQRVFTADEYAAFCGTHSDHIVIPEPLRTEFFEDLRKAVLKAGDRIVFNDTYVLYLAKKP